MRMTTILAALAVTLSGPALAAPTVAVSPAASAPADQTPAPVPIEEWSLARVTAMGREIYRHDTAAWLATDALLAARDRDTLTDLRGWIVVPEGDGLKVRYLREGPSGDRIGWDVVVTGTRPDR
jgi:hypothetical protein